MMETDFHAAAELVPDAEIIEGFVDFDDDDINVDEYP